MFEKDAFEITSLFGEYKLRVVKQLFLINTFVVVRVVPSSVTIVNADQHFDYFLF